MTFHRHVAPDAAALAEAVAAFICDGVQTDAPAFAICLSGGQTPGATYRRLSEAPFRDRLPWPRIHWFLTDERFVSPDDPRSNLHMVREALFARAPVPAANIHAVATVGVTPEEAARAHEQALHRFYGSARLDPGRPFFDVVLLGIGGDGHTASLFPHNPAVEERARWALAVHDASVPEPRITLTLPLLGSSRRTAFLAQGANKASIVARLVAGDPALPASHVPSPEGGLEIFIDEAAAGGASA